MKIKTGISLAAMMVAALLAGCSSSVSAPPIDLPAPITGRIDVSAPDANGNVTVTGTEGAVAGSELVMVVNETTAASASLFILDLIVPSAYASSYPAICSTVGYACEYAEADGSFVMVIAAESDDALTIGLIYSDSGEWRSERISVSVPQSGEPEPDANCTGLGLSGAAVDVKIAPTGKVPILLRQGSETTTNQLIIGEGSDATTVDITGCYAHSIAITQTSTGDLMAVTSEGDKTVWAGRLVSGAVTEARSFTVDYEPMDAIFVGTLSSPIVAMKTSDSVLLQFVSLSDGSALETMAVYHPSASTQLTGITRSIALDSIKMDNSSGDHLGLLITDDGNNVSAYITLFIADTLIHKLTVARSELAVLADEVKSIVDGALYVETSDYVRIAVLDSASTNNSVAQLAINVLISTTAEPLIYSQELGVISQWDSIKIGSPSYDAISSYDSSTLGLLKKIKVSKAYASIDEAIIATSSGWLVQQDLYYDTAPSSSWELWSSGANIVAIDLNDTLAEMFGADATTGTALDGSTLVY